LIVTAVQQTQKSFPSGFYLEKNNPDPFKEMTMINITLPSRSKLTVIITNSYGKVVDKLISREQEAGTYALQFIAEKLPRGTYFCHVVADKFSETNEMELIK
jgi:hypothetical protein